MWGDFTQSEIQLMQGDFIWDEIKPMWGDELPVEYLLLDIYNFLLFSLTLCLVWEKIPTNSRKDRLQANTLRATVDTEEVLRTLGCERFTMWLIGGT